MVELAGGALIVVLIVLFATGALDIGGGSGSSTSTSESRGTTAASSSKLTQAVLRPLDGGEASGRALFGRIKSSVVLQVEARDLEPSAKGQSYAIWLARSPRLMLPLAAAKVDGSGKIAAQYQLPAAVLAYLATGAFGEIAITRVADSTYEAAVARAGKEKKPPSYTGAAVLRGTITGPIVGAAKRR